MWIYIARLRRTPNALVSLVHRKEMGLESRLEGVRTQRRVMEVSWKRVPDDGACDGEGPTIKLAPVMWHVELTAAGGAKTLTTGDVGGQRATVGQMSRSLALHAPVNSQSELVLVPLRSVQSVQLFVK